MSEHASVQGAALTFLLFLMVTREMPGTGFMPSFCMAFLLFFSERLCLLLEGVPSSARSSHNSERSTSTVDAPCSSVHAVPLQLVYLLGKESVATRTSIEFGRFVVAAQLRVVIVNILDTDTGADPFKIVEWCSQAVQPLLLMQALALRIN